jgi:hypothetical protein
LLISQVQYSEGYSWLLGKVVLINCDSYIILIVLLSKYSKVHLVYKHQFIWGTNSNCGWEYRKQNSAKFIDSLSRKSTINVPSQSEVQLDNQWVDLEVNDITLLSARYCVYWSVRTLVRSFRCPITPHWCEIRPFIIPEILQTVSVNALDAPICKLHLYVHLHCEV